MSNRSTQSEMEKYQTYFKTPFSLPSYLYPYLSIYGWKGLPLLICFLFSEQKEFIRNNPNWHSFNIQKNSIQWKSKSSSEVFVQLIVNWLDERELGIDHVET